LETTFWTLVETTKFAAFSVTFYLHLTAVWTQKLCWFWSRRNWFSATCAGYHR